MYQYCSITISSPKSISDKAIANTLYFNISAINYDCQLTFNQSIFGDFITYSNIHNPLWDCECLNKLYNCNFLNGKQLSVNCGGFSPSTCIHLG